MIDHDPCNQSLLSVSLWLGSFGCHSSGMLFPSKEECLRAETQLSNITIRRLWERATELALIDWQKGKRGTDLSDNVSAFHLRSHKTSRYHNFSDLHLKKLKTFNKKEHIFRKSFLYELIDCFPVVKSYTTRISKEIVSCEGVENCELCMTILFLSLKDFRFYSVIFLNKISVFQKSKCSTHTSRF